MKKLLNILKRIGIVLLSIVVLLVGLFFIYNEELPEGEMSEAADQLAYKMLKAVNHEAFQNTKVIEWTFVGKHHYKWYKPQQLVYVKWDDYLVHLNTRHKDSSTVFDNKVKLKGKSKLEILEKAISFFNNDSFWLVAPQKVFDPGTEREIVALENGDRALLVKYTLGGNTPGDSYLWILDESGLPKAFKMWVHIIPIGGIEASWDSWVTTESGALLPTNHKIFFLNTPMSAVRAN